MPQETSRKYCLRWGGGGGGGSGSAVSGNNWQIFPIEGINERKKYWMIQEIYKWRDK